MRRLTIIVLVAALGWFAYWFIAAQAAKTAYEGWFEDRRSEDWQAEYSELHLRGFPNRIDTTFDNIQLADPDTGIAWSAPFFQIFALSYKPNHLIAVWPNEQTLSSPLQKMRIASDDMKASVVFNANTSLALNRANFATEALVITSDLDWSIFAQSLLVALAQDENDDALYQFALQGQGVAPPQALRTAALPETMSALDVDASVGFDRPWDIHALNDRRPQPKSIAIRNAKAQWGPMLIQAVGEMTTDENQFLQGELTLRAEEWQAMIDIARDSGQIDPLLIDGAQQIMRLFSSLSGPGENIDLTLTFRDGRTFAGFLPIGIAPQLVLR
ncbi:MAG: DUF2125 domain-containing protein [Pseudomonadota bacterium]|nr:DUF2125 domain-containing protein [Pseudomonadota bacterium]